MEAAASASEDSQSDQQRDTKRQSTPKDQQDPRHDHDHSIGDENNRKRKRKHGEDLNSERKKNKKRRRTDATPDAHHDMPNLGHDVHDVDSTQVFDNNGVWSVPPSPEPPPSADRTLARQKSDEYSDKTPSVGTFRRIWGWFTSSQETPTRHKANITHDCLEPPPPPPTFSHEETAFYTNGTQSAGKSSSLPGSLEEDDLSELEESDSTPPAARALAKVRRKPEDPDLRSEGPFTDDEQELVRRILVEYKEHNSLTTEDLCALIQYTRPRGLDLRAAGLKDETRVRDSQRFWSVVYENLPRSDPPRSTTSIQKFVRRHYTMFKGAQKWSAEEDERLEELCADFEGQWQLISTKLGTRSPDACRDRWQNHLKENDQRKSHRWTDEEKYLLQEAVAKIRKKQARKGDASDKIDFVKVSARLGHSRNPLQCRRKWHAMQRASE